MGQLSYTHQLQARTLGPNGFHIIWRRSIGDGVWRAYLDTERAQKQYIRLHLLDGDELIEVFKFMRDIVTGEITEDDERVHPDL